jgi:hypothetical protein
MLSTHEVFAYASFIPNFGWLPTFGLMQPDGAQVRRRRRDAEVYFGSAQASMRRRLQNMVNFRRNRYE